jgi:molybdopterin molybdotransferase
MITASEATDLILSRAKTYGTEEVALNKAIGRVLAQDLKADRPFPPFTRVSMDGIAIQYDAFEAGQRSFNIEGIQAAGAPSQQLQDGKACLEVMTGAVLPANSDTVIRYEDVNIEEGVATIIDTAVVKPNQNAHEKGSDRQKGDILVSAGRSISPAEIGVAATVGHSQLLVQKLPTVAIISTGDELVPVEATPAPHQIRSSNIAKIQSLLKNWGITASPYHIVDDMEATQGKLNQLLEQYDVLILSGGVSKGKFDYLPAALEALQVKKHFHRISQRPGKPFWFGESRDGTMVFALPGNPVSSFVCTIRYFQPWLRKSLGLAPKPKIYAQLAEDYYFKPDLTYFLQVAAQYDENSGALIAKPIPGRGSGDLANLVDANAFLELPKGQDDFEKGAVYPLWFYR